jgi:hypothetical protein
MTASIIQRIRIARKIIKQSEFQDQQQMQRWRSAVERNKTSHLIQSGSLDELRAVAKAFVQLEPSMGIKFDIIICSIMPE